MGDSCCTRDYAGPDAKWRCMRENLKIMLVDQSTEFRVALKKVLRTRFPTACVSEASDACAALRAADIAAPNVLIFELEADPLGRASVANLVREARHGVVVIALSVYPYLEYQQAAADRTTDLFYCKSADGFADEMMRDMERHFGSNGPALISKTAH
jgi:DNA-binding NarL/FixJ family response regulator